MGKGTSDRDVLGLVMSYEGEVTASQNDKHFEETSLTKEVVSDELLKKFVLNDTIGNDVAFQVVY